MSIMFTTATALDTTHGALQESDHLCPSDSSEVWRKETDSKYMYLRYSISVL